MQEAWSASQRADGRWVVRFGYRHRGRDRLLSFELDDATGEVVASDRASGELGYVAPVGRRSAPARRVEADPAPSPVVPPSGTGFRERPEARRGGTACVRPCRSRGSPYP